MTGSGEQSSFRAATRKLDCFVASAPRNDGAATPVIRPSGRIRTSISLRQKNLAGKVLRAKANLLSGFNENYPTGKSPKSL
jgi:hypothetical protein